MISRPLPGMQKKRLDAVIFDFDGVLVDSVDLKTEAFAEIYKDYGDHIQKRVVAYHLQNMGVSRYHKFRYFQSEILGKTANEEVVDELADKFANLVKHKVISEEMIPGANQSLKYLHNNNIPTYIASGTPEEEILEIVEKRNLKYYFKTIYGSPKSKSEILRMIINTNNYNPSRCIMIGDAMEDYKAAQTNKCDFIGVAYKTASKFPVDVVLLPDLTTFTQHLTEKFNINV